MQIWDFEYIFFKLGLIMNDGRIELLNYVRILKFNIFYQLMMFIEIHKKMMIGVVFYRNCKNRFYFVDYKEIVSRCTKI